MDGTVIDILGYPATPLSVEARIPAINAPIKAAAAGGKVKSSIREELSKYLVNQTGNKPMIITVVQEI